MNKIAIIGPHHQDGWDVLQKMNFDVFEITDLTKKNLIKELIDVKGIAIRTAILDEEILSKCSKLHSNYMIFPRSPKQMFQQIKVILCFFLGLLSKCSKK